MSNPILPIIGILLVLGIIGIIVVVKNKTLLDKLLSIPLVIKIITFAKGMLDGLLSVRKLKSPLLFLFSTLLIWVLYYLVSYVLFFCIPETSSLGPLAGLTLLVVGAIGMTAPTQGGIGAYHLLVGNVMVLYGLTQADGITLATFIHGTQMLFMLVIGAFAFLFVLINSTKEKAIIPAV